MTARDRPARLFLSRALSRALARAFDVAPDEAPAVGAGFLMFFFLFAGYFSLRPARETFGVAGGVENLQWLFTGTFLATLAALPAFGWLASKVSRRRILPCAYLFFTLNLLAFAAALKLEPDSVFAGRAFYIWLSVFNLAAISLAWSALADVLTSLEAKRLFALVASGASLGGLAGPLLGAALVAPLGHAGLLVLAALFLVLSAAAALRLYAWRDATPAPQGALMASETTSREPLGGSALAGAAETFRSPYLLGISAFVTLLACVSTFLYFEQARLVAEHVPDRTRQTQLFGAIDAVVQLLAILTQMFLAGRVARRLGVGALLVAVPAFCVAGFLWLALAPSLAALVTVMIARRAGEYALARPGREMLYSVVSPQEKYKAKNFIDTVVYRGADAVSGWLKRGLDLIGGDPALAMTVGAATALVWGASGAALARSRDRAERGGEQA